jgi:hypothetical protein
MSRYIFCLLMWWMCVPAVVQADDRDLFSRALELSQQGQWQQAADLFSQISSRNPQWPEPKNNLAVCLLQQGKIPQAQQALDAAVTSQPGFRVAHLNRQRMYDYLAAQAYDKAVGQKNAPRLPQLDLLTNLSVPAVNVAPVTPAASAPVPAPAKSPANVILNDIRQQIQVWSQAWASGDVKNYLASYSTAFKSEDGKSFEQWAPARRLRLQTAGKVSVETGDMRFYTDSDQQQVIAEFVQLYRANAYQDKVLKQLLLVQENGRWLIAAERVIAKY